MQERIKTHNKLFSRGKSSYKMGNNEYSDLVRVSRASLNMQLVWFRDIGRLPINISKTNH